MDRNREGRRGSSGGGSVTAPRRPRTNGFKDSPVVEDDDIIDDSHNSRLRERAKKESYSGGIMSGSRNKRKRQVSHEMQIHGRSTLADDVDESTEETEMGLSEDDDDLPLPPISRKPGKLRLQAKSLDDGGAVDLSAVPRKARTAVVKRPHDSPPRQVADFPRQQSPAINPLSFGPANTAPSSSNAVLKPGRRMKPSSSKSRASKLPKVSGPASISEQEVEVAEALFDLARMVPTQASSSVSESNVDLKLEPMSEPTLSSVAVASVSAPASAYTHVHMSGISMSGSLVSSLVPVSSSDPAGLPSPVVTSGLPPAEAPKRKRPRVRPKKEDEGSVQVHTGAPFTPMHVGLSSEVKGEFEQTGHPSTSDIVHAKAEVNTVASPGCMMDLRGSYALTSVAISTPSLSAQLHNSVDKKPSLVEDVKPANLDPENIPLGENATSSVPVSEIIKDAIASSPGSSLSQKENEAASELAGVSDSLTELELVKRFSQSPSSDTVLHEKTEIDLMQAPPSATEVVATEMTVDIVGTGLEDEKMQKNLTASTQNTWLDGRDKQFEDDGFSNRDTDKELVEEGDLRRVDEQVMWMDFGKLEASEIQRESFKERELEKEKAEFGKHTLQKIAKNKADTRTQKTERSGASSSLVSVTPASSSAPSSIGSPSLPISLGMGGWPAHLGYYSSSTTATWPAGSSVSGVSMDKKAATVLQVPSFVFPGARQLWKRCSSHAYIAHFISWQQQILRRPVWTAAYGNTAAGLYGNKPYNLNIPLSSGGDVFGSGTGSLTGSSGTSATVPGNEDSGLGLGGSSKERPLLAPANLQGSKERLLSSSSSYLDALAKKTLTQQPAQVGQQLPFPLQAGPAFGFPVTQAAVPVMGSVPTATTGSGTANLIGEVLGPGNGPGIEVGSGAVVGTGVGTTNSSVANAAAAAHVQYLQAVIQQGGFPFSFPPTQFGPTFNGPSQQQAPQFFGHHLNYTHLVHPFLHSQHGQMTATNASIGFLSSQQQQQQQHLQQAVHSLQSSGSPQRQPAPHSPSQSQQQLSIGTASQQLQRPLDRESNMGGESSSTAESKFSALQRNMQSQTNPKMKVPSVNCSPALGAGMPSLSGHPQDFSLMTAFGGKQTGKIQQQQASVQLHAQQSAVSSHSQQQHVTGHHHMGNPALQMSVKCTEQVSQSFSSMPVRNAVRSSVGPGPLGLAPVAAVMAPQGHAMLQTMSYPGKGHSHIQSLPGQAHQHTVLQGQQQHPGLILKASSSGVEDSCVNTDEGSYTTGSRGRDTTEDRKALGKRTFIPIGHSRIDPEVSSNAQGSPPPTGNPTGLTVPRMAGSPDASLNLMASTMGNLTSQSGGQSPRNAPGPAASQSLKSSMGGAKTISSNTTIPSSAAGIDPSLSPFTDRSLGAALNPFPGLIVNNGSQALKQGHASHNVSQIKLSQRVPPSPAQPPAGLAAATMGKHQSQPQPRGQQSAINMVAAGSRVSASASGSVSSAIPLPPLPHVSKSSGVAVAKSTSMTKSTFPVSQKATAPSVRKPASAASLAASSIIAPSPVTQNTPGKATQPHQHGMQQQQHSSQTLQQNHTSASAQQSVSQQYHQQLLHTTQVPTRPLLKQPLQPQLQMRQQFFLYQQQQQQQQQRQFYQQQEHQHQQQQSQPHSRSPTIQSQAMVQSPQHQPGQPAQQQSLTSGTLSHQQLHTAQQQVLKHVQPQQTLQPSPQYPPPVSFGAAINGLSLVTPNLTLGTGSSGKNNSSDGLGALAQAVGSRPSTPVKSTGNSAAHLSASSRRNNSSGSTFLHSQMASSNCSTPCQQQMDIPDEISQDRLNGIYLMPGAALARLSQPSSTAMSPPAFRPQTGASIVKHTGHQFVPGHMGEAHSSKSGMSISSASHSGIHSTCGPLNTVPIPVNGAQVTGVHLNSSDGKGMIGATSATVHQGGSAQQPLPTSGQPVIMMTANIAPNVASGG